MTDNTIFEPGQMMMADEDESVTEPAGSQGRKALIGVGAAGVALLLAFGGYTLLGGGGDAAVAPTVPARAGSPASPTPSVSAPAVIPDAKTSHAFRDPFKPLLSAKGAAVATGTAVSVPKVTVPKTPATKVVPLPPVGGSAGAATPPVPAKPVVKVKLISVDAGDTTGKVAVNGVASTAAIGVPFAEKFKALRFSEGSCGTFQYGDERFDLCEGQTATMR